MGRVYDGRTLTLEDYGRVETAYVETAAAFAREAGVGRLQVRDLEKSSAGLENGVILPLDAAAAVIHAMLREEVICKLEAPGDDFAVHVGFDLYMYVGAARPCPEAISQATQHELYVDTGWPSPQLPDEALE